ncbi:MAG: hypothetical protein WBK78_13175 [Syntrophomonadaceae bacterium]
MKRIIILMLALLLVPAFPVLAGSQLPIKMILSEPSQEEIDNARENDFKTIEVLAENIDGSGDFMGVEWINQSVFSSTAKTTKYKTIGFEYQIGPYIGYVDGYYFHTPGSPGQEIIEKVTITREALINSFMTQGSRAAVEEALDTEAYLYVRARIMIYNDRNGDGKIQADEIVSEITRKDEINTKAAIFPEKNKQDMRSRFQEIPINAGKKPDFYPTPEGSSEWNESYLECAKTYSGKPGEEITFPVNLYNIGTKASTDFRAVWAGQGDDPEKGWAGSNPPWKAEEPITLAKGESITFDVTITVPQPGEPNKLFFKANVDGNTPAQEVVQENNIMAICIGKEGLDIGVELDPRQPYWQIPSDLGYVHPIIDINFSVNIDDHEWLIIADGYKEVVGITKESLQMVKTSGKPPLQDSISFKVTEPGKYTIRAGIPTEDENGTPILFDIDGELQPDINPANNHDEIIIEVSIGPPSQIKTDPDIDTGYEGGDHMRSDLTG